ncbi:NADH-quinone oxidoreductase subunit A [Calderihabitans maritimus]|uniref:NADH-quinone oxidoreductase subunit A n=1 Tax=Calderihabitans maritimus TaxID=1246530 RepID=A0A1Z5HTV4_9FIRM|nr:NADH-quinone oxidoreductase subunit A [Calderihabitans maritimus]GAW92848.1 NADH-quinone oxidoreductase subunit A [Calderihabitans maritimus]
MLKQFAGIGIFFLVGAVFPLVIFAVSWLVRPKRPSPQKLSTYECGLETQGPTWVQFKISYFLYALIFLLFDVETVFLYPWAVKFQVLGLFAFIEMLIFIAILVIGLWYAWKEGALEWK